MFFVQRFVDIGPMTSNDPIEPALGTGAAGDLDNPAGKPTAPVVVLPPEPTTVAASKTEKKKDEDQA